MYTLEQIRKFQKQARELGFAGSDGFCAAAPETLLDICNGFGPDAWPQLARDLLTWLYGPYGAAAAQHDYDYTTQTKIRREADEDFAANMRLVWKSRWNWFERFLRPSARREKVFIEAAALAVRNHGGSAWAEAAKNK